MLDSLYRNMYQENIFVSPSHIEYGGSSTNSPKLLLALSNVPKHKLQDSGYLQNYVECTPIEIVSEPTIFTDPLDDVTITAVFEEVSSPCKSPKKHQSNAKYLCFTCGRSFSQKTTLLAHTTSTHAVEPSTCSVCFKTFHNGIMLKTHMIQHTGIHPFKCVICDKGFIFDSSLSKHMLRAHEGHSEIQCGVCQKKFTSSLRLKKHEENVHEIQTKPTNKNSLVKRSQCSLCEKSVSCKYISYHMKSVHGILSKHECKVCNEEFHDIAKYKDHMAKHITANLENYSCDACKKVFKTKGSLQRHISWVHGDRPRNAKSYEYECDVCARKFQSLSGINNHVCSYSEERKYHCNCGRSFYSKTGFTEHQERVHFIEKPLADEDASSEVKEAIYPCSMCSRSFLSYSGRKRHEQNVHSAEHPELKLLTPKAPVDCHLCDAMFRDNKSLREHMSIVHDTSLTFACSEPGCDKSYNTSQGLRQHEKFFHKRDKSVKFPCTVCGKLLSQDFTRKQHMTIHTGLLKYSCDLCSKPFRLQSSLKEHLLTHTNIMPVVCQICQKNFRKKSHLRTHMRTHTGERPYACDICGRAFAQSGDRNKHRINMHKD